MKVLYTRIAQGRKKKFQIKTKIVSEDGKKYVLKEAVCVEAQEHIENTFRNEIMMEHIYGGHILHGQWEKDRLMTPYIVGETLGSRLRSHLEEKDEEKKVRFLLQQWKKLIIGSTDNICKFRPSDEFEEVFGKADDLEGVDATIISNFDCSAENIFFLQNEEIKILDFEWVFSFPIPAEMSFYRVLKLFFECNQGLIDWKTLIELAGIDVKNCYTYDRLIESFVEYVSVDKDKGINYALMGKKFKLGKIIEKSKETFLYRFPYDMLPEGKKIVLYGAGRVGEDFYKLLRMTEYCQIAAWVDKSAPLYRKQGLQVQNREDIKQCSYDYVLIAVYQENVAEEIRNELIDYGINPEIIVWGKPQLL